MLQSRDNNTTISIYVQNVTALVYDKASRTTSEKSYFIYNEKAPSEEIIKKEVKEEYGDIIIDILSIELDTEKSGCYKLSHRVFASVGEKVGEVRGHANKKSDK